MERQKLETEEQPPWLNSLLGTTFFSPCKFHGNSTKNECNMYCLDCMNGALCSSCLASHRHHHVIQIRRSSYHDVIRVSEIQKVLDISGVQTYVINSAKVVFLNERPQPRPAVKCVTNACKVCDRSLLDTFAFCSLGCKLAGSASSRGRKTLPLQSRPETDDSSPKQPRENSTSNLSDSLYDEESIPHRNSAPTHSPTILNYRAANRRKGIPHRAPMGLQ